MLDALSRLFDYSLNQASPVQKDFAQVEKVDEDGNVFVSYEEVDYPKVQSSFGLVKNWSLDVLLKAGINPNFPIHTGNTTRLAAAASMADWTAAADSILSETSPKSE